MIGGRAVRVCDIRILRQHVLHRAWPQRLYAPEPALLKQILNEREGPLGTPEPDPVGIGSDVACWRSDSKLCSPQLLPVLLYVFRIRLPYL